jgi:HAD superfamily hydrolase (TIGR01457 family)
VLERYRALLLDLDGVLFRGDEPVPGAAGALAEIRARGRRPVFVTNNSSRTPEQVAEKLVALGFEASPSEVVTSALALEELLGDRPGRTAYVIGEDGVREALRGLGIDVLEGDPEAADLVVVGWDRAADYPRLKRASLLVQRGARLLATNADASYPAPDGNWPGAGALLAVIEVSAGVRAEVAGKPRSAFFERAARAAGEGPYLVVGDRLETDVAGAEAMGWDSALVLTGVSTAADLLGSPWQPTYVVGALPDLLADPPRTEPAAG